MSPAKSEPLAVRISRELASRIISGQIEAGARLRQDHFAEEFGSSHVPVREAFRRLELGSGRDGTPPGRSRCKFQR